jgi:hypothetical protein
MSVLATLGFLIFGTLRFVVARSSSGFAVGSFALGSALLVLVAATYVTYAIAPLAVFRAYGVTLLLPVVVFFGVFAYALIRRSARFAHLMLFAVAGFVGLWFFGFYAGLTVSCSFGDCL